MKRIRLNPDWFVPTVVIIVLAIIATLGFRGIFPDFGFVAASAVGAVGAAAVALLARSMRLHVAESVLVSFVGFVAMGAVATTGLPTANGYRAFFDGLINGWARVLTSLPPAILSPSFRVLPYTVAWFATLIGIEVLRSRQMALAVIGPLAGLIFTALMTLEDRRVALAQGAVLALGMLTLGWLQHRRTSRELAVEIETETRTSRRRALAVRTISAISIAVVACLGAIYLGPRLPSVATQNRFDLRELQTPPFDPLKTPTPLGQVKVGLLEANTDRVMFTVTSPDEIDRLTLAVLDNYNDEYWLVADESRSAPARFRPVDLEFPPPTDGTTQGWRRVTATLHIEQLSQLANGDFRPPWVPSPGWPVSVSSPAALDLRFNTTTGTIADAPDGLAEGTDYTIEADLPPPIEDLALANATVTKREPVDLAVPQLRSFAADTFEGTDFGWEQVEAVRKRFVDTGAYDSRPTSPAARPGHTLGRLAEFVNDPEHLAGFEEQYAATAAALLRSQGVPVRVVVGFVIPEGERAARTNGDTVSVHASDISAWIEVEFDDIGWIPFDVTPPRDRLPDEAPINQSEREVAVPNPPVDPPTPVPPPDLELAPNTADDSSTVDDVIAPSAFPWRTVVKGSVGAFPLILLAVVLAAIVLLKRRRTRRRRTAVHTSTRIAGAWYEVVDRCREDGSPPRRAATTLELARGLRDADVVDDTEGDLLVLLASDVDRAAFAPDEPDEFVADHAWWIADTVTSGVRKRRSIFGRVRAKFDPRPLLRPDPVQRALEPEHLISDDTSEERDE